MRNFFKGISFSSICAGALAAVTSFLFSAKIGIAGSVIGVAAGSIVSAVATQVYKNVLKASGEKIQNAVPLPSVNDSEKKDSEKKEKATSADSATTSAGEETRVISSERSDMDETVVLPASARSVRNVSGVEYTRIQKDDQTSVHSAGENRFRAWLQGKHAPIVIAVVSALIGVAVSAGLILAFTGGKGTDTIVRERIVHSYTDTGSDSQDQAPSSGHMTDPSTSNGNSSNGTQSDSSQSGQSGTSESTNSGTSNGTSNSTSGTSGSSNSKSDTKNDSTSSDSTGTSTNDSSSQQGSGTQDSTSQSGESSGSDSTSGSTSTDGSGTSSGSNGSGDSSDSASSDTSNSSTGSSN